MTDTIEYLRSLPEPDPAQLEAMDDDEPEGEDDECDTN